MRRSEVSSRAVPATPGWRRRLAALAAAVVALGAVVTSPLGAGQAAAADGWTSSATVTPSAIRPGSTANITVTVTSRTTRLAVVDVEIYRDSTRVKQRLWQTQAFRAGKPATFTVALPIPATQPNGQMTVKVGVFKANWTQLYHWNDAAATFMVAAAGSPGAPRPGTTVTTAPPTTAPATTAPPTTAPATTAPPTTAANPGAPSATSSTTATTAPPSTAATTSAPPATSATTATTAPTTAPPATSATTVTTAPSTTAPATTAPATTAPATTAPATLPAGTLWSEDFQTAQGLDRLVKQISWGDNITNHNPMQHFNGDHNGACEGPATTRPLVEDYQVATHFWFCAPKGPESGHFMTGINTVGYVIMAFSPKADGANTARVFPATATQACWDQNLTDLGSRKWTQLVVVSASRYQANGGGINYVNPDFNTNGGASALRLAGDDFLFVNLRNSVEYFNGQTKTFADYYSDDYKGSTDKATRYTICVKDNGNGTVTRTQTRPNGQVSSITGPGRFPAGPRVFIIEDDSYNPMKAYTEEGQTQYVADPFTWHWDNIRIG